MNKLKRVITITRGCCEINPIYGNRSIF